MTLQFKKWLTEADKSVASSLHEIFQKVADYSRQKHEVPAFHSPEHLSIFFEHPMYMGLRDHRSVWVEGEVKDQLFTVNFEGIVSILNSPEPTSDGVRIIIKEFRSKKSISISKPDELSIWLLSQLNQLEQFEFYTEDKFMTIPPNELFQLLDGNQFRMHLGGKFFQQFIANTSIDFWKYLDQRVFNEKAKPMIKLLRSCIDLSFAETLSERWSPIFLITIWKSFIWSTDPPHSITIKVLTKLPAAIFYLNKNNPELVNKIQENLIALKKAYVWRKEEINKLSLFLADEDPDAVDLPQDDN